MFIQIHNNLVLIGILSYCVQTLKTTNRFALKHHVVGMQLRAALPALRNFFSGGSCRSDRLAFVSQ